MTALSIIVPARGGSRRLPGKNLRRLGGASLLEWTIRAVRAAGIDQAPLLTTDDEAIAAEGRRLGYAVPFIRPPALGRDDTPALDVVLHALDTTTQDGVPEPDFVMLLQVTSPFRSPDLLREGLARIGVDGEHEALISVKPLSVDLNYVYGTNGQFLVGGSGLSGRACVPSGALYIVRLASLRRHATFFPPRCLWLDHDGFDALDIDTEEDWIVAEAAVAAGRVSLP